MKVISQNVIKQIVIKNGADLVGIAPVDRFSGAPEGFHPVNVYKKTKSVLVFAKRIPAEGLYADSCIPYTHSFTLAIQAVDTMTFRIATELESLGIKSVIIPTDDPYEYWDDRNKTGKAILSLRHCAYLAGLGVIGRNNLLVNNQFGNMIQIGAILTDSVIEPSPLADYKTCSDHCRICLDSCPVQALNGTTVNQQLCRPLSVYRNGKGYVLQKCFACRKNCPLTLGLKNGKQRNKAYES
jgi:epoxyqueuosine reductase QueG